MRKKAYGNVYNYMDVFSTNAVHLNITK